MSSVNSGSTIKVTPRTAQEIINRIAPLKRSLMLAGPPGVGKSALVAGLAAETMYTAPVNRDIAALEKYRKALGDDAQYLDRVLGLYGTTKKGVPLHDVRLVQMSPTDVKGIPVFDVKHGEAKWVQTGAFPTDPQDLKRLEDEFCILVETLAEAPTKAKEDRLRLRTLTTKLETAVPDQYSLLFLDEITVAAPMVQAAALQLVLDRKSGMYSVPDNVLIVAAGNRIQDRVGASVLTPTMASRMTHIEIEPNFSEWMEDFAVPNGINSVVTGYLKFRSDNFMQFKPELFGKGGASAVTFPCPRTWTSLATILDECPEFMTTNEEKLLRVVAAGTIGEAYAIEFCAFVTVFHVLPDVDQILTGKIKDIKFLDFVPLKDVTGQHDLPLTTRKQQALGLSYAFNTALNHALVTRYREALAEKDNGRPDRMEQFKKVFGHFLDYTLQESYLDNSPEMAIVTMKFLLQKINIKKMRELDERATTLVSRANKTNAWDVERPNSSRAA